MSKPVKMTVREFHDQFRSLAEEARTKSASALKATDPNYQGNPDIPSFNTEKNRSNINLPNNPNNLGGPQDLDGTQGLCTVTNPSGVGQGNYPNPIDGNARDAAFTSPSTPISKIAGNLAQSVEPTPSADQFNMPERIKSDIPLMQKLAYVGSHVLATKQGQQLVNDILLKQAGRLEAQSILNEVYGDMQKQAAYEQMYSQEACEQRHMNNINNCQYDFEKSAYMQGAMDGDAMADAAEAGMAEEAELPPTEEDIADDEIIAAVQALVESGQVTPEEAEAFIASISQDQAPTYTGSDIAAMIAEDVESGVLTPEAADALAAEVLQQIEAGNIPA